MHPAGHRVKPIASVGVGEWVFLTGHARVLVCVARDPEVLIRDIATTLGMTERSVSGILGDLVEAGYVVREKDGRRNRYHVQDHLPLGDPTARDATIGELLDLLAGQSERDRRR